MQVSDFVQTSVYLAAVVILSVPLGWYMARVYQNELLFLQPLERLIYRLSVIDSTEDMTAKRYTSSLLMFTVVGFLGAFLIQIAQKSLFLNPQHFPSVPWAQAFNTAASFVTNTNWQSYSGESTLSYLTQMLVLTVQNFVSAAAGIAVVVAFIRGLSRQNSRGIGNFWVDLTKTTLYILLPLSFLWAILLMNEGVIQNLSSYIQAKTIEGVNQLIPMGPAASQIAIKQLGTNGGGFFGANSAHPFENPTPFSNFLEMLGILLIPAALIYMFGLMIKSKSQATIIFAVMLALLLAFLAISFSSEHAFNPVLGLSGSLEGKEVRFGVTNSILWSTITSATSSGSVNAMHDSLSPLAGGAALFQILLGEIVFGGAGSGLYGMLLYVLLTVFLTGLMIGRMPEYLGKKIEAKEMQMVVLAILVPITVVLIGTGASVVLPSALSSIGNAGPHGLTEILYAWGSATNNNGSAFGGLNANTNFYNISLGIAMILGRFGVIIPTLIIAGSLAQKQSLPHTSGSLTTDTPTFALLLLGIIVIVGALTYLPALALGPIVEHLLMNLGRVF